MVLDLVHRLEQRGEVHRVGDPDDAAHTGRSEALGERTPRDLARGVVLLFVDDVPAQGLHRFSGALRCGERHCHAAREHADLLDRFRELLLYPTHVAHREALHVVRNRSDHEIGFDRLRVGGRADAREAAAEPLLLALVVEDAETADKHEVALVARLDDARLVLGELRVALFDLDLAPVDPAGRVAPLRERVG